MPQMMPQMMTQPTKDAVRPSDATNPMTIEHSLIQPPQCLLIIDNAPEHLQILLAELKVIGVETTWSVSHEEIAGVARLKYDLVVVDVEPRHLVSVLKTVRDNAELTLIPVLVECSRLETVSELAGVLPRYRAMPCGFAELLKLIRLHLFTLTSPQRSLQPSVGLL